MAELELKVLTPDECSNIIRTRLRVKGRDTLPLTGWNKSISRIELAGIMGDLGYKYGAEIGVHLGGYSKILCQKIPGLKILCVDPYIPYRGTRPSQERMDRIYKYAQKNLKHYNVTFIRKTSIQAVSEVPDGSLDFVYIDAMHEFDPVIVDIVYWTPKVRIGGMVAGHDYTEDYQVGVVNAVRAYTFAHAINEWYLTYDVGIKPHVPSWFWIRKG